MVAATSENAVPNDARSKSLNGKFARIKISFSELKNQNCLSAANHLLFNLDTDSGFRRR